MSVSKTFTTFTLYDLVSNIIPGATVLITGTVLFLPLTKPDLWSGGAVLTAFVIMSFLFGRVIQAVASYCDNPEMFGDMVDAIGDESLEAPFTLTEIEKTFWTNCKSELSLTEDFDNHARLMKAILSYLETRPAVRALRFQAIWTFCRNMYIVGWITIAMGFIAFTTYSIMPHMGRSVLISGFILIGGFVELAVFHNRREKFNKTFIKYLFIDFHLEASRSGQDNSH